ncbi:MAG: hypothetical protein IT363_13205 [Methanoregulaceae archaeon]|nr:hypothetical protein [Methanoregulaceae archaeon]
MITAVAAIAILQVSIPVQTQLELIGDVQQIQVVAFGRNGEPARGRIVITNDHSWAFGNSTLPGHGKYLYRWPVKSPERYQQFHVYWATVGDHRRIVDKPGKPYSVSRGSLIAALSKDTVLLGADTDQLPPGAFRWEVVALNPIPPAKVRRVAAGGERPKPNFGSAWYDSPSGLLNTNRGQFRVAAQASTAWTPRYKVERRPAKTGSFYELDTKTGGSALVDDADSNMSFRYWRNAMFRASRDGSGHDFWDRGAKQWVRLGFHLIGESADRTSLVFADHSGSSAKPAPTYIVRLKKELR